MKFLLDLFAAIFKRQPAAPAPAAPQPVFADAMLVSMVYNVTAPRSAPPGVADAFAAAFDRFRLDNRTVQAHILVHCAHESGDFTFVRENLNYSSAARIREVFGGNRGIARLSDAYLHGLVRNPEALANIVYADSNRGEGYKLGNTEPGDGWKFRGWGWPQLTGGDVMRRLADHMGISVDELLNRTDAATFAYAAVWLAVKEKPGFTSAALNDKLPDTRKLWNGGQIGLADCQRRREQIRQQTGV